jgi:DNA-binding CsgD family transcriptional regulator
MEFLAVSDVEAMIRLLATVADPTVEMQLAQRKRALLEHLGRLIDADVWIWAIAKVNPALRGDAAPLSLVDGGWLDETERAEVFRVISHPELGPVVTAPLWDAIRENRSLTISRDRLMSATQWQETAAGKLWHATGFDHFLISSYPIGDETVSNLGFHRRLGRPSFTERDFTIVNVMTQQIDWLHRQESNIPAAKDVVSLSARERQIMMFLLGGDSRKEVAAKLKLSTHTVADYLKIIYRKLRVNSRAELLSKFIPGGFK